MMSLTFHSSGFAVTLKQFLPTTTIFGEYPSMNVKDFVKSVEYKLRNMDNIRPYVYPHVPVHAYFL